MNTVEIVSAITAALRTAGIEVPSHFDVEISHHYGLGSFERYGAASVSNLGRKYFMLFPGQVHPEHYHRLHTEWYRVISGKVEILLDGMVIFADQGDELEIVPGRRHLLRSQHGALIEETFSSSPPNDSYYTDPMIPAATQRKTIIQGVTR